MLNYIFQTISSLFSKEAPVAHTPIGPLEKSTTRLEDFSLVEKLSHSDEIGAYGAPSRKEGELVFILDQTSNLSVPHKVIKLKTASTGLVGEIFVPVDPTQSQQIYINWTGTHSLGTMLADLERAPGEDSYRNEEIEILNQLNTVLKNFGKETNLKANIVVSGHSLGGALAQQNWHSIQRAIACNLYEENLDKGDLATCGQWVQAERQFRADIQSKEKHIGVDLPKKIRSQLTAEHVQSITLGVWNSAGVLKAIENNSNQLASMVNKAGIQQRALFGMVGGDAVQTTGEGSVLTNIGSEVAAVSLIKINKGCEGYHKEKTFGLLSGTAIAAAGCLLVGSTPLALMGLTLGMLSVTKSTVTAHTSKHFINSTSTNELDYQLYTNTTDESRKIIQKKLTNKSTILQCSPIKAAQRGLYFLLSNVIESKKSIQMPVVLENEDALTSQKLSLIA